MRAPRRPISINFASIDHRLLAGAAAALTVLAVVLALVTAGLLVTTRSFRAEYHAAEKELAALALSMEKHKPALEERQRLMRNLSTMTALLDARDFSWVRLLSALEKAFPPGVALSGLSFTPKGSAVSLEGKASSPEALSGLMIGLETSGSFRSPQLKRQSLDKGIIEFHVEAVYHDAPAGGKPQEPVRSGR